MNRTQLTAPLRLGTWLCVTVLAQPALAQAPAAQPGAPAPTEEQNLLELRNTVINLLQGLVQRGVLTQQDAQAMVADAQRRAETDTAVARAKDAAEADAVRVTYVPEIVKEEIAQDVRKDVQGAVVDDVVARAKSEGWGVPGALPGWVRNIDVNTRLRVRGQGDYFDESNAVGTYLNLQTINDAGGISKAGPDALMNTTEDRSRLRARLRVDLTANVAPHVKARLAFATGNANDPISMNQTLANYGRRLTFGVQNASIEWNLANDRATRSFDVYAGRFDNPFLTTSLLWDEDLSFEGVASKVKFDVFHNGAAAADGVYLTLGGFPLEEVQLNSDDKWLYAAQIGVNAPIAKTGVLRFGAAYYTFKNITGLRNAPDSKLNDYTRPALLGRGNSLFDIRNDLDPTTNLFALASEFKIADVVAQLDLAAFGENHVKITAEYLENRGFDLADVTARLNRPTIEATKGRQIEVSVGRDRVARAGDWRVFTAFRHLEQDAVLDAFTDSDFGLGGTDTEGYVVGFDIGVANNTWITTKWLSSNEIDGPPLAIDVLQLDLNTRF